MPINFTILIFLSLFLVTIPLFVNRNTVKTVSSIIVSKIIIFILFLVCTNILLIGLENKLQQVRFANCPPELVVTDSTFGSWCRAEISNPFERILDKFYGGPFDGFMLTAIGLLAVFILSIVGFVTEIKSIRKHMQPISKALWSVSFLALVLLLTLAILLLFLIFM